MARSEPGEITAGELEHKESSHSPEPVTPRKRINRRLVRTPSSPLTKSPREHRPASRTKLKSPQTVQSRWTDVVSSAFFFAVAYAFEVIRVALVWLRKPLSLILVGYMLAVLVSYLWNVASTTLRPTLSLLCDFPGISRISVCQVSQEDSRPINALIAVKHADYPKLVDIQSATFEQLLDKSVGGAGLALEIKKAEMATSDLSTLVKVSGLTSKEKMAETLDTFVQDARKTARGLQRFSAKVGGAVDGIIAVNDYALNQIESAASKKPWISTIFPFFDRSTSPAVLTSFNLAMEVLEAELRMLIMAAEASLHDLEVLEEQLRLLHMMVSREDASLSSSKRELLANIWTRVGGNRAKLQGYDTHLKLLDGLSDYRRQALAHVVGALQTLQTMSAELEALRERVSRPVLMRETVPLEVHVRSIRGGLERLTEGRLTAKTIEDAKYAELSAPLSE